MRLLLFVTLETKLGWLTFDICRRYVGTADAFKTILREEGLPTFYRGLGVRFKLALPVVTLQMRILYLMPAAGFNFLCYEHIKHYFKDPKEVENSFLQAVVPVVGLLGGRVFGSLVRTPFDILKQRQQIHGALRDKLGRSLPYQVFLLFSVWCGVVCACVCVRVFVCVYVCAARCTDSITIWQGLIMDIIRKQGVIKLFSLTHLSLLRDVPFMSVYFISYEVAKSLQQHFLVDIWSLETELWTPNHLVAGTILIPVARFRFFCFCSFVCC